MSVYADPPKTEGGERRQLSDNVDVIIHDLEENGLLLVIENRDASLHQLKFDFSQCENLKVDIPPHGVAKTDRFKCEIEVPGQTTMNLTHLKVVDVGIGSYDMRYRVAISKLNQAGEMEQVGKAPEAPRLEALPPPTGPAVGAEKKKVNDHVTLLTKQMDDSFLFFLEMEGTPLRHEVTIDFSESTNVEMDPGPDVEQTAELSAKLTMNPQSRVPLARLRIGSGDSDATLKYKVNAKPIEEGAAGAGAAAE